MNYVIGFIVGFGAGAYLSLRFFSWAACRAIDEIKQDYSNTGCIIPTPKCHDDPTKVPPRPKR